MPTVNAMAYAHAGINIALDVWMLYLPATQVLNLRVSFKKKLGIMSMFGLGVL